MEWRKWKETVDREISKREPLRRCRANYPKMLRMVFGKMKDLPAKGSAHLVRTPRRDGRGRRGSADNGLISFSLSLR
ncbi:hypothetical protein EVAR_6678_1 [Eumeta japonica]|uniref:Uncharacterized protein n=1 Tax=Eumeta variegata TaxID=151549 RepID=A0A4C1TN91_EUMVA|nr:hypothetical protein EVAR_6678_1 [Eumeta japonica]